MELIICAIGSCVGLYVGIWKMLIPSIVTIVIMFVTGNFTIPIIAYNIFRFIVAIPITELVYVSVSGILLIIYDIVKGESF